MNLKKRVCHKPHPIRPERAEAPSPGQRPGSIYQQQSRPVRAKAFKYLTIYKAFALSGRFVDCYYTQGDCPGLGASALSGRVGKNVSAIYLQIICANGVKKSTLAQIIRE